MIDRRTTINLLIGTAAAAAAAEIPAAAHDLHTQKIAAPAGDAELADLVARYDIQREIYERALAQLPDVPGSGGWVEFDERTAEASWELSKIEWAISSLPFTSLERVLTQARVVHFRAGRLNDKEVSDIFFASLAGVYNNHPGPTVVDLDTGLIVD